MRPRLGLNLETHRSSNTKTSAVRRWELLLIKDSTASSKCCSPNIVAKVPFNVDFSLTDTTLILDEAPFGFVVPYPANAGSVQIVRNNQVLTKANITTGLLRVAIQSIPATAFRHNADNHRKQLLKQCDLIDVDLSNGNTVAAINKMQNNIRVHFVQWLNDNYPTTSPLQYTKPGILQLVDELVQRLSN